MRNIIIKALKILPIALLLLVISSCKANLYDFETINDYVTSFPNCRIYEYTYDKEARRAVYKCTNDEFDFIVKNYITRGFVFESSITENTYYAELIKSHSADIREIAPHLVIIGPYVPGFEIEIESFKDIETAYTEFGNVLKFIYEYTPESNNAINRKDILSLDFGYNNLRITEHNVSESVSAVLNKPAIDEELKTLDIEQKYSENKYYERLRDGYISDNHMTNYNDYSVYKRQKNYTLYIDGEQYIPRHSEIKVSYAFEDNQYYIAVGFGEYSGSTPGYIEREVIEYLYPNCNYKLHDGYMSDSKYSTYKINGKNYEVHQTENEIYTDTFIFKNTIKSYDKLYDYTFSEYLRFISLDDFCKLTGTKLVKVVDGYTPEIYIEKDDG